MGSGHEYGGEKVGGGGGAVLLLQAFGQWTLVG